MAVNIINSLVPVSKSRNNLSKKPTVEIFVFMMPQCTILVIHYHLEGLKIVVFESTAFILFYMKNV